MDVQSFMNDDLRFIEGLVADLNSNITKWPSDKVLEKTNDMMHAFNKRFAFEDLLFCHIKTTASMQKELKLFLANRTGFRQSLEKILMLDVDEPDFRSEIAILLDVILKQIKYLCAEFDPRFIHQISAKTMAELSSLLEEKLRFIAFA